MSCSSAASASSSRRVKYACARLPWPDSRAPARSAWLACTPAPWARAASPRRPHRSGAQLTFSPRLAVLVLARSSPPLRCSLPLAPTVGHSCACCWRSSAWACRTLATASARFWLPMSTRAISVSSAGSLNGVHQRPACQSRAVPALIQPACGAALFHAAGTVMGGVASSGARLQPARASSTLAASTLREVSSGARARGAKRARDKGVKAVFMRWRRGQGGAHQRGGGAGGPAARRPPGWSAR